MSTKPKQPRKDAAGGKKKRETTPDKPTPVPNAEPEQLSKQNEVKEHLQHLVIKDDELEKIRGDYVSPFKMPPIVQKNVTVLKENKEPKPRTVKREVQIAKQVDEDTPLKPVDTNNATGPRFDGSNQIVPHSLLGLISDYIEEASRRGEELPEEAIAAKDMPLTVKFERRPRTAAQSPVSFQTNALQNWQMKMRERKKQHDHISKSITRPTQQILMVQAENFRPIQETRQVIDRCIPAVDYGKGYRIGSEFWNQPKMLGDELTGIHMTLSKSDQGYPPPLEQVGKPLATKAETSVAYEGRLAQPGVKGWYQSKFFRERMIQLHPLPWEYVNHEPDFDELQVVGTRISRPSSSKRTPLAQQPGTEGSIQGQTADEDEDGKITTFNPEIAQSLQQNPDDPLCAFPNTSDELFFGPALRVLGVNATWTGDETSFISEPIGILTRLVFECAASKRVVEFIEIVNDGTAAIQFSWEKQQNANPFNMGASKIHKFYFDTRGGMILPGDSMKIPVVFKPGEPGIFMERWRLNTRPVLCGGAPLAIFFKGVSLKEDTTKAERELIEKTIAHREAHSIASWVVDQIVSGIRERERPRTPIDAYITEQERFERANPGLVYRAEIVSLLQTLHNEVFAPELEGEQAPIPAWDLSVIGLKELIETRIQDDTVRDKKLQQLFDLQRKVALSVPMPLDPEVFDYIHGLWCEVIDQMDTDAVHIRNDLKLPPKESHIPELDISMSSPVDKKGKKLKKGKDEPPAKGKAADKKDAKGGKGKPGSAKLVPASPADRPKSSQRSLATPFRTVGSHPSTPTAFHKPETPTDPKERLYQERLYYKIYEAIGKLAANLYDIEVIKNPPTRYGV